MKISNRKTITLTLALLSGLFITANASAAQTVSLEQAISQFIINQSQQVVTELNMQLSQSITAEVDKFIETKSLPKQLVKKEIAKNNLLETNINQVEE